MINNFLSSTKDEMLLLLNRTWNSIINQSKKLNLYRKLKIKWTDKDINYLKTNYCDSEKEKL